MRNRARRDTGLAARRIRTIDQHERTVLDFVRCATLPLRDPDAAAVVYGGHTVVLHV